MPAQLVQTKTHVPARGLLSFDDMNRMPRDAHLDVLGQPGRIHEHVAVELAVEARLLDDTGAGAEDEVGGDVPLVRLHGHPQRAQRLEDLDGDGADLRVHALATGAARSADDVLAAAMDDVEGGVGHVGLVWHRDAEALDAQRPDALESRRRPARRHLEGDVDPVEPGLGERRVVNRGRQRVAHRRADHAGEARLSGGHERAG